VIIVLGAPNDERGRLSEIARHRCDVAAWWAAHIPRARLLLTGGFGDHFNTTSNPHAYYTREYLQGKGILPARFLEFAESRNTIEDAKLARGIVTKHELREALIVTSDFHAPRARILFERELRGVTLHFSTAPAGVPQEELQRLLELEQAAIRKLAQSNGAGGGLQAPR